jgi:HK97 family phage major capsid protein
MLTVEAFLTRGLSEIVPISDLQTLARDDAAFGDDVAAAFRAQKELRIAEAERINREGDRDERGELLASEARKFDRVLRETQVIDRLIGAVQDRTRTKYTVPPSAPAPAATTTEPVDVPAVLARDVRMADWLRSRGAYAYAGERGIDRLRFGAVVRALALGSRDGLSDIERRVLSEGVDASGGYTVPEVLAVTFIDRVRNAMVTAQAGAQTVPMTSDVVHLARLDSASAPTWKAENDAIPETSLTFGRVSLTARTLPALVKLSVELSEDSANVDAIIERELSEALARELDRAALLGTGTGAEPRGIRHQPGVSVTALGAAPTDYGFLIDSIGRVWKANHAPTARVYNASLATRIAKFTATDGQPLVVPPAVANVPEMRTNQIPDAGSPPTTTMIVGDFSQLLIGMRTTFRLEVTRVAGEAFERLQVWVRAYLRADVQLAHPEAFDVVTSIGV